MTTDASRLNAASRAHALEAMTSEGCDVLVIGAGVTGAGIALDAATRGVRVAVVDAKDAASGTSQWSSKMVHGGLRYLATGQLGIAHESARERHHLMTTIAPHLVRPRRNLLPTLSTSSRKDVTLTAAGLGLADGLRRVARTSGALLPRPGRVSAAEVCDLLPTWHQELLRGGLTYVDGELEDDARLVITLLRTAAAHGARVATYVHADVTGEHTATLRDELTGETSEVRAGVIIAATGVWAAEQADVLEIVPSRGTHLVVEAATLGNPRDVVTLAVPGERGRYVFLKPAPDGLVFIGLTDDPAPDADGWNPGVPEADVDFLLSAINPVLERPLGRGDIVGVFSGLRPLVAQQGKSSADTSRDHVLVDEPGRPLVMTGGKLTTYRAMAEQAVDAAAIRLRDKGIEVGACVTRTTPLVGAAAREILDRLPVEPRLVARYGTRVEEIDALIAAEPTLGERVTPSSAVTRAELVYGITHEGAMTAADLVERRARLSFRAADVEQATVCASDLLATYAG